MKLWQFLQNRISARLGQYIARSLGIFLTVFLIYAQTANEQPVGWLERIDWVYYDLRFAARPVNREEIDPKIVILDLDEASIQSEGRWPWPRRKIAELVQAAYDAGAMVLAFDVVFSEPEENVVNMLQGVLAQLDFSDHLEPIVDQFDGDGQLQAAMASGESVLGYFTRGQADYQVGVLPEPLYQASEVSSRPITARNEQGYTANLLRFQQDERRAGYVTAFPDSDGSVRRSPLMVRIGENLYPSLALSTTLAYLLPFDPPELSVSSHSGGDDAIRAIKIGNHLIRTDSQMQVMVPYKGGARSYTYVSARDVLHGEEAAAALDGAIVLLGTSAAGLYDLRSTPVGEIYPGVEVHANLIDGLLQGKIPYRPDWEGGATLTKMLLVGLLAAMFFPLLSPLHLLLSGAALIAGEIFLNWYLWNAHGIDLPIAAPLLLILGILMFSVSQGFLAEAASRRKIRSMFDQYVPPQHVNTMLEHPERFNAEGESRNMTVFFMDIRDFTHISESLETVRLSRYLSQIFTPVTYRIFEEHGTIDKYVGDMVMAFWGAPLNDEKHAFHSVSAALKIVKTIDELQDKLRAQGFPETRVGIGINTGVMHVGDMGSEVRRAYTVLGDSVNLASRLEALTRYYDVPMIIGENTWNALGGVFAGRELDRVSVKGKFEAVRIYQPMCLMAELDAVTKAQLKRYAKARDLYLERQWQDAMHEFEWLYEQEPELLYSLYIDRIKLFQVYPPAEGWQGEYTFKSKTGD